MAKTEIVTPEQLMKADKIVTHQTALGAVSFVVQDSLKKSYVEAHYRHTADGALVFIHGYHNKVYKKPDELQPISDAKHQESLKEYDNAIAAGKKKKAPPNLTNKYNSFHFGDEVFVRYSHMHDQHFGVGAVVGTRDDEHHDGLLVNVRLLDGRVESYRPDSLVHIHKEDADKRTHEESHHTDDTGKPIDYKHLSQSQKIKFYDLYKLFYRLHRMGEYQAFQNNKQKFLMPDGSLPTSKTQLSAEQKIELENLNNVKTVPHEAIIDAITQNGYNNGQHHAFVKKLLGDIEAMQKEGVPNFEFPKLYVPKSKKHMPYVPSAWLTGMFPSTVEEADKVSSKEFKDKLAAEHTKLIAEATGLKGMPSTEGQVYGNPLDFYHGKPIVHGQVKQPKNPDGTQYEKAAKVPTYEDDKKVDFKSDFDAILASQPDAKEKETKKTEFDTAPVPVIPVQKKAEPKLVVGGSQIDLSDLENEFVCSANANKKGFTGAHSKYILKDSQGNEYLFKPYSDGLHRVWADIISSKLAKALGIPQPDMGSKPVKVKIPYGMGGNYQGQEVVGSVQRIVPDLQKNNIRHWADSGNLAKWKKVPKEAIEQLQREHVMDWLLGNNDAHADQFIIDKEGNLIGIDKGQSFKHYQNDVLSLDYDPNVNKEHNDNVQVYNLMMLAAKEGHIKLDWNVVHDFIENNVAGISTLAWVKLVTPYAEHSAKWGGKNTGKFQSLASKRKANAIFDFKKLYASVGIPTEYNKTTEKYEAPQLTATALPESDKHQPDAFHQIDAHFHTKMIKSGAHGYSRMMGGGDIEDMSVLFTHYKWDQPKAGKTGKGLEASFKLLAGAEDKIIKWFENVVEDQSIEYMHNHGTLPQQSDPLSSAVILAAKTVNHHAADGAYNEEKMNQFAKWFQSPDLKDKNVTFDPKAPLISPEQLVKKLVKGYITSSDFDDHLSVAYQAAKHYHKIATDVMEAIANKTKTASKTYQPWEGEYKSKKISVSDKKFPYASFPKFLVDDDGNLMRKNGEKDSQFGPHPTKFGAMFTKDLPGNIQVRYYPHYSKDLYGQNNLRSQQGQAIIDLHSWDGDVDSMHQVRKVLKDMGIDHRLANHHDMECMALTRYAWQQKADISHKAEFQKVQALENGPKKIDALKELCKKVYGTSPDELKTYDPTPKWDNESGHHHWWNPYVLNFIHYTNPAKVKVGIHRLTSGTTENHMKNLAKHGLLSIESRHKFGWSNYKGMSTDIDQKTGGAAYVGLAAHPKPKSDLLQGVANGYLVFRPELFARSDAFAYEGDGFGTTHTDMKPHSSYTIKDRLPIMETVTGPQSLYEVRFKGRVPLDKWFVGINAGESGYDEYSGKTVKGWIKQFRDYLKEYRPHILNHVQFKDMKE